ncbi:MAG: hypothetical protein ABR951_12010 [Candidatus Aminicenantales bacterium]|jgi:hypothetical protein
MKKPVLASAILILFGAAPLFAQGTLFYLELQAVAAYSTAAEAVQLYSQTPGDVMQKPSLGFDLVQRLSGGTRDWGVLAIQARVAYDQEGEHRFEPQLYNAYVRLKAGFADIWAGHDRPALGLDYALDSHALLLAGPAMMGYGFDRDWGVGLQRDTSWGSAAASLTTGSGMPLYFKGNYLAALRVSGGVLARDNWSVGASLASGRILDTMGNHLMSPAPLGFTAVAADATYLWRNLENRVEVLAGRKAGENVLLLFWRAGLNLLSEGRLKLEVQPAVMRNGVDWSSQLAGGVSFQVTADLAARSMIEYDHGRKDARFVLQLYYYKGL